MTKDYMTTGELLYVIAILLLAVLVTGIIAVLLLIYIALL